MESLTATYPDYGFEKHVGYGTAQHIAALKKFGVTELHRHSYKPIRALLE
jgi:ribonuclease HII